METLLVLITLASLAVAVTMSIVAWRCTREARTRSEARVAALADAIHEEAAAGLAPRRVAQPAIAVVSARAASPSRRAAEPHVRAADFETTEVPAVGDMFAATGRAEPPARRFGPAFVLGALAVSALIGTLVLAGGAGGSSSAATTPRPLELLSLRHAQQAETTTVSGLVRNPRGAATIERVTAVVFFFDGAGAFLSSARAPLDFPRLAGGEESAFQVSAPTPPGVRRYRVSFRLAEGGIVPHVDRREN